MATISPISLYLRVFLLIIFLHTVGCSMMGPANHVIITSPIQTTRMVVTPDDFEFRDALQHRIPQKIARILSEDVVAWSVKANIVDFPPGVYQEAVVVVDWIDETNRNHVSLAYCKSWGAADFRRIWEVSFYPPGNALKDLDSKPSPKDIAEFIRSSNFGYNECTPRDETEIWRVVSYRKDPTIVDVLQRGIPSKERNKRYSALFERF